MSVKDCGCFSVTYRGFIAATVVFLNAVSRKTRIMTQEFYFERISYV